MPEDLKTETAQQTTPAATEAKTETTKVEETKTAESTTKEPVKEEKKETTKEPEAEKKVAPEKYDLKLSDGSHLSAKALDRIASFSKEQGLSQDEAQALVQKQETEAKTIVEEESKQWQSETQADKELGGEKFKNTIELAHRAMKATASPKLQKMLEDRGGIHHPEVIRHFYNLGKMMGEDKLVSGSIVVGAQKSLAERLYPNSKEK